MHAEQLIRMANQIGSFFEAMPDRGEALENTARHIKSFWEPRMRRALLAHVDTVGAARADAQSDAQRDTQTDALTDAHIDAHGEPALSPFVAEALSRHRASLA